MASSLSLPVLEPDAFRRVVEELVKDLKGNPRKDALSLVVKHQVVMTHLALVAAAFTQCERFQQLVDAARKLAVAAGHTSNNKFVKILSLAAAVTSSGRTDAFATYREHLAKSIGAGTMAVKFVREATDKLAGSEYTDLAALAKTCGIDALYAIYTNLTTGDAQDDKWKFLDFRKAEELLDRFGVKRVSFEDIIEKVLAVAHQGLPLLEGKIGIKRDVKVEAELAVTTHTLPSASAEATACQLSQVKWCGCGLPGCTGCDQAAAAEVAPACQPPQSEWCSCGTPGCTGCGAPGLGAGGLLSLGGCVYTDPYGCVYTDAPSGALVQLSSPSRLPVCGDAAFSLGGLSLGGFPMSGLVSPGGLGRSSVAASPGSSAVGYLLGSAFKAGQQSGGEELQLSVDKLDKLQLSVDKLSQNQAKGFDGVNKGFDGVNKGFDGVNKNLFAGFEAHDEQFSGIKRKLAAIEENQESLKLSKAQSKAEKAKAKAEKAVEEAAAAVEAAQDVAEAAEVRKLEQAAKQQRRQEEQAFQLAVLEYVAPQATDQATTATFQVQVQPPSPRLVLAIPAHHKVTVDGQEDGLTGAVSRFAAKPDLPAACDVLSLFEVHGPFEIKLMGEYGAPPAVVTAHRGQHEEIDAELMGSIEELKQMAHGATLSKEKADVIVARFEAHKAWEVDFIAKPEAEARAAGAEAAHYGRFSAAASTSTPAAASTPSGKLRFPASKATPKRSIDENLPSNKQPRATGSRNNNKK